MHLDEVIFSQLDWGLIWNKTKWDLFRLTWRWDLYVSFYLQLSKYIDSDHLCYIYLVSLLAQQSYLQNLILSSISFTIQACGKDLHENTNFIPSKCLLKYQKLFLTPCHIPSQASSVPVFCIFQPAFGCCTLQTLVEIFISSSSSRRFYFT